MEHARVTGERHRNDLVNQLCEERAEPQDEGLPACRPLGAEHHVAASKLFHHYLPVVLLYPFEEHGSDGREEPVGGAEPVDEGDDMAAEGARDPDGIHLGTVVAGEE